MIITTREEQAKAASAARKAGGWDKLICLSDLRAKMSPDDWRKVYQQEFPPPEIVTMTRSDFDRWRRLPARISGMRFRQSHDERFWTIKYAQDDRPDAIIVFVDSEGNELRS